MAIMKDLKIYAPLMEKQSDMLHLSKVTWQQIEICVLLLDQSALKCSVIPVNLSFLQADRQVADLLYMLLTHLKNIGISDCSPIYGGPLWIESGQQNIRLYYAFTILKKKSSILENNKKTLPMPVKHALEILAQQKKIAYQKLAEILPDWYELNARKFPWREDRDPYHIWLSEIMLQQTRASVVIEYYRRFVREIPSIAALAEAEEDKILKLWEGLGYYSRARNLQRAARQVMKCYAGKFPQKIEDIRTLPGIGGYTAGAIAAICFNQPEPAIDGNVLRVLSRVTGDFRPIQLAEVRREMEEQLKEVYPKYRCDVFEQSLIELGAIICLPKGQPKCIACPIAVICSARRQGVEMWLPARTQKKQKKVEEKTIFLFCCGTEVAVQRRENQGLLAGLWEFPNVAGFLLPQQVLNQAQSLGVEPIRLEKMLKRMHEFTHVKWDMRGYVISCSKKANIFEWIDISKNSERITLPSAFKVFLQGKTGI